MEYEKIQTVFFRDIEHNRKFVVEGKFSKDEFDYLKYCRWEFTEKVNGTNTRIVINNEKVLYKGKTDNASIPSVAVNMLIETFNHIPAKFEEYFPIGKEINLYGECYGKGINEREGSRYNSTKNLFILFDVNIAGYWLARENCEDIAKKLNIDIVPIVGYGMIEDGVEMVKQTFKSIISEDKDLVAEGIVARPMTSLFNRKGERIIWKLKTRDFERKT